MSSMRQQWRNGMIGLIGALALVASGAALADPPTRVARLAHMSGTITFSPAGEEDWAIAQANRPVVTGDRLWADANSHLELQIGDAAVRIGNETSVNVLNLDDQVGQFQLAQGTLNLRVRRVGGNQFYEIDTPNLAFSVRRPGVYRIDVDPQGNTTTLRVLNGEGEAWGEGAAYVIGAGQLYTFTGQGLRDYQIGALPPPDEFDRWAIDRDRREETATSARFVSPDLIGYSDLDEYGTWRDVQGYGNVWVPTSVESGWAPYHNGHWAWIDPWGWTWIDDAPWGFAPFHYGRWAYLQSRWCWVPGPRTVRPVYAPALVAFVGGGGFSLSVSSGPGVAWFPLGFGEVYRPSYAVSRAYFTNINVSNTVVNTTVINNYYNNTNVNVVYRNREVPGAVVAVSTTAFASGRPVHAEAVSVSRDVIARQQVTAVAAVAPTRASVIAAAAAGGAAVAVAKPRAQILDRRVVAKAAPPPPPPSFAAKEQVLAAQPGKPLDPEKLKTVRRERPAEQNVKVVAPPSGAASAALKPLPPAKGGPEEKRGGQPPTAAVPQPPQERGGPKEERRGPPPTAAVPQPPQERGGPKEERRGPPPTAAVPQPPQERGGPKEERRGPPPTAAVPQPPAQQQERAQERRGPPPTAAVPQPPAQQQERAMREERRGPPPAAAQQQPPQPQPQPQAKQAPPQPQAQQQAQAQQGGKGEARREEARGKDKEKDKKEGQPQQ
jgi:hypothetical protein